MCFPRRSVCHIISHYINVLFTQTLDLKKKKSFLILLIELIKKKKKLGKSKKSYQKKNKQKNPTLLCITPVSKPRMNTSRQRGAERSLAQPPPVSQFQIAASLAPGKETHGYI